MSQPIDEPAGPPGADPTAPPSQQPADTAANPENLGERLRAARYAAHLTQEGLAGKTFSKSYISAVERSKMTPSIPALRLLAERLGVSLAYLLGEQEQVSHPSETTSRQEGQPGQSTFAQRLDEAETLLRGNDAAAALDHLGSQEASAAFGAAYEARWCALYAWALLRQQRVQEVDAVLERGLAAAHASQDRRSEGYLYRIRAATAARREEETAEQTFQRAIDFSEQINDDELLGSVCGEYGAFLAEHGRYQEAYEQMRLAQEATARFGRNH